MKFYGSMICSDCVYAAKRINQRNIDLEYVDVTDNIHNLKEFLRLRDSRPEFDDIKALGKVGIPCFLYDDGRIEFDVDML